MEKEWGKWKKKLRLICIIGVLSAAVLALLLIIGNTAGLWEKWFGITFHNQYLLFDNKWGSDRGFTWKAAAGMFAEMTPLRKLFGAGPDCFKAYSYSIPEYADLLYQYWKPNILTNAHNEFLNLLICIGIVGLFAFLAMLGMGVWRFFKAWEKFQRARKVYGFQRLFWQECFPFWPMQDIIFSVISRSAAPPFYLL